MIHFVCGCSHEQPHHWCHDASIQELPCQGLYISPVSLDHFFAITFIGFFSREVIDGTGDAMYGAIGLFVSDQIQVINCAII